MTPSTDALALPIEHYVDELSAFEQLPVAAATVCIARYTEAGPLLRTALNRAADRRLFDGNDELLFFRALHIVGACRDPHGFQPLLRFLRRADKESEQLLGDAIIETLPAITAGVFDGDSQALFATIVEPKIEPFIRDALFRAAAFLTWDGRIDRRAMIQFLERFDSERLAADGDFTWFGWAQIVACLGLRDMVPAVVAAAARGSLALGWERKAFDERLAHAERAPRDLARIKEEFVGYLDDVVAALQQFEIDGDGDFEEPAENPWRGVGRNDPCPCGSGKKAKRCCLAA